MTCCHVRSPLLAHVVRPSRSIVVHFMPVICFELVGIARGSDKRPCPDPLSKASTSCVRRTWWGIPSTFVEHDRVAQSSLQVLLLDRVGHRRIRGQQEARAHRYALGAVGQRRDQSATVEEAARRDDGNRRLAVGSAQGVDDRRQEQRCRDRAGVAAALAALHDHRVGTPRSDLHRVLGGTDRRDHDDAVVLRLRNQLGLRCECERRP